MKNVKVFILILFSLTGSTVKCKEEIQKPTLRMKIPDFNLECSTMDIHYNFIHKKFASDWKNMIMNKKGRVQCGKQIFDFTVNYYEKDSRLAFIDIKYKGKTYRLAEIPISEKNGSLFHLEIGGAYLVEWSELTLFSRNNSPYANRI